MGKLSSEDYEATNFLGGILGTKEPYLKRLAMQRMKEREILGSIESLKIMIKESSIIKTNKKDKKQRKGIILKILEYTKANPEKDIDPKLALDFFDKVIGKIIEIRGLSGFRQGEVTNLSMRIASTKKSYKGGFDEKFE